MAATQMVGITWLKGAGLQAGKTETVSISTAETMVQFGLARLTTPPPLDSPSWSRVFFHRRVDE